LFILGAGRRQSSASKIKLRLRTTLSAGLGRLLRLGFEQATILGNATSRTPLIRDWQPQKAALASDAHELILAQSGERVFTPFVLIAEPKMRRRIRRSAAAFRAAPRSAEANTWVSNGKAKSFFPWITETY
jgi:hypothetical protein